VRGWNDARSRDSSGFVARESFLSYFDSSGADVDVEQSNSTNVEESSNACVLLDIVRSQAVGTAEPWVELVNT
jgi:exosome complex RNA-binding protein Csl4